MKILKTALAAASALSLLTVSTVFAQTAAPSLKVITPTDNQTIYGDRIPLLFAVENFQIVDYQKNPSLIRGQGHIHVWLDDVNHTAQTAKMVIEDNTLYTDVPYGNHTLRAELVNNNHISLTPPVVTTVSFKSAQIASPSPAAASGFDKNTALVILVVVALVIVAAWWYTREEDETPKAETTAKKTTKKPARKRRK